MARGDAMTRKSGLGRGLDSLIPGGDNGVSAGSIYMIPVGNIEPNPRQPRVRMDPGELAELTTSVREYGVLQPLIVTKGNGADKFILIAGERRLMASREAGLEFVPAIVREASEQQFLEIALVENVQRADLSPLEAAEAYRQLTEEFGLSHEEVADRVGKSRTAVTNTLRLLKLPETVLKALAEDKITEGHARALLGLLTPQSQANALQTILRNELNVRQTEELVRRLSGQKEPSKPRPELPPEMIAVEQRLRDQLGTKVSLNPSRKGGTMVIHYYSEEELDVLVNRILGDE